MSSNIAVQRIKRELNEMAKSGDISIEPVNNSLVELRGRIVGPPDTPYENGTFELYINAPETYPFNPPKVRFLTRIWHPNISSVTGAICLDILKDKWAAAMSIRTVLLSLQALMAAAEPDDPQDAVVAKQYKESYELFRLTAKHWTSAYAAPTVRDAGASVVAVWHHTEFDNKIKKLMEVMRVDEHRARVALSSSNWDLERATQALL